MRGERGPAARRTTGGWDRVSCFLLCSVLRSCLPRGVDKYGAGGKLDVLGPQMALAFRMENELLDLERQLWKAIQEKDAQIVKPVELDAADASTWVRRNGKWLCALHTESLKGDPFGRDRLSGNRRTA